MLKLPETVTFDLKPYGKVTLANLRQRPNENVAGAFDVVGDVISGVERSYLWGHVACNPATGTREIYGVEQGELDRGHIVRAAM